MAAAGLPFLRTQPRKIVVIDSDASRSTHANNARDTPMSFVMPVTRGRATTRLEPEITWTLVAEAPLKGLSLAREAGRILAWDEASQLYLLSMQGETLASSRLPGQIAVGAISDDGSLVAVLSQGNDANFLLLDAGLGVQVERPASSDSSFLSIDPHGRYVAIGSRLGPVSFVNRFGRVAGRLETVQPLAHLCFVADRPLLIASAAFGLLFGIEVHGSRSTGRLELEIAWQDRLMSNVGRLCVSGVGGMILASCFTHGIQRFDLKGRNEGSYHLGGTVSHAVTDFPGRSIVATTLEGELALMNSAGNVRWRTQLSRPAIALEFDPLGRFLIHGQSTGEIVRLNLFGPESSSPRLAPARAMARQEIRSVPPPRTAPSPVRRPDWMVAAVRTEQEAQTAVMAITEDPVRVVLFTSPHRLDLYTSEGQKLSGGLELSGVGRILRTAPGWLAAATDRQVGLLDLRRNSERRLDLDLVELTHLDIKPDSFGLALVQERDRIGRVTPSGRWVWKRGLQSPVEDLAIGPEGFLAITTSAGQLLVFDPAGQTTIGAAFDPSDPPLLIEAPERSPRGIVWLALTRRHQKVTAHDLQGKPIWSRPLPWEGWSIARVGPYAVVTSTDGRVLAFDGSGTVFYEGSTNGSSNDAYIMGEETKPVRVTRRDVHLICSSLDGRVLWRAVGDGVLGPLAAGPAGVAILFGQSLAWFKAAGAGEMHLDELT